MTGIARVKSTASTIEYWYSRTQGCAPNMIMSQTMLSLTGPGLHCHTAQAWPGLSGHGSSSVCSRTPDNTDANANANGKMLKEGPGLERTSRN